MKRWIKRVPLWLILPGGFVALRLIDFAFSYPFQALGMDGVAPDLTPVAFAADVILGLALALVVAGVRRLTRARSRLSEAADAGSVPQQRQTGRDGVASSPDQDPGQWRTSDGGEALSSRSAAGRSPGNAHSSSGL